MIDFHNIGKKVAKVDACDVNSFTNPNASYTNFVSELEIERFRHLTGVKLRFTHPITLISGTNRIGKTSILLLLACSHENFYRLDSSKPEPTWRQHIWKDVMAFTKYETEKN
ncbi:MAG: AAA family ATPase, partial [Paracoccaceae bacterium]|nr:AAA family ATPase [Paracoccaceae bacterium]